MSSSTAKPVTTNKDGLFSNESLGLRLEFSINMDMISNFSNDKSQKPPPAPPTRTYSKYHHPFRKLIKPRLRKPSIVKPENGTPNPPSKPKFNLQLWNPPISTGSFGFNFNDEQVDPVPSKKRKDQPPSPPPKPQVNAPLTRRWSSAQPNAKPSATDSSLPERGRSLMFSPILDVAAVGALMDTFPDSLNTKETAVVAPSTAGSKDRKPIDDDDDDDDNDDCSKRSQVTSCSQNPPCREVIEPNSPREQPQQNPRKRLISTLRRVKSTVKSTTTNVTSRRFNSVNRLRLSSYRESRRRRRLLQPINNNNAEPFVKQARLDDKEPATTATATVNLNQRPKSATINAPVSDNQQQKSVRRATTLNVTSKPPPQQRQKRHQPILTNSSLCPGYAPIAVSLKSNRSRQFLLNTPLGEFEILRTLGQGSYGKVKLMRSALTGEQFAVKIIKRYPPHKHRRGHQEYRKAKTLDRRVVREANLSAILGQLHPHIVPLHDFRVTDTHFYLFYAYVNGITLAERVGSSGMDETDSRLVFKAVVETIHFCHQYSVIHRDIKLENVLIDYSNDNESTLPLRSTKKGPLTLHNNNNNNNNQYQSQQQQQQQQLSKHQPHVDYRSASVSHGQIKIIDFGLANFFDGTSLMETFCGSLPYTAPEILRGDAYVGPEIDVWSLGVLLYVMHTGQFPFEDPAQSKNFDKIMAGDFLLRPSMSHHLQDLLIKMLEPNSKRRITMQGVLQHRWISQNPTQPGVCCHHHPYQITNNIHDCRRLLLPGSTVNVLVAREVATCLDRTIDEILAQLERAMSRGRLVSNNKSTSQQWPHVLTQYNQESTMMEVPNSPIVSVYALVLQQINMRRYYLELPTAETANDLNTSTASIQSSSSRLTSLQQESVSYPNLPQKQQQQQQQTKRSQNVLVNRLAEQFDNLVSLTGNMIHGSRVNDQSPAYYTPLTGNQQQKQQQQQQQQQRNTLVTNKSLPTLHSNASPKLKKSRRRLSAHSSVSSPPLDPFSDIQLRTLGALEDVGHKILLPTELISQPSHVVLGLISSLLQMHEIIHTFVEMQTMPLQKALDTSMFSLKTIATLLSTANQQQQQQQQQQQPSTPNDYDPFGNSMCEMQQPTGDLKTRLYNMFSKSQPVTFNPNANKSRPHLPTATKNNPDQAFPKRRLTQLRNRVTQPTNQQQDQQRKLLAAAIVHPHLAPRQSHEEETPVPIMDIPEISATIPVSHPTAVIFAQYSPSLNRWRETEVVEYYSCSVRLELVRTVNMRHKYALLVDRMTGHKGKFALFKMFLQRMVAVLPSMIPPLPHPPHPPLLSANNSEIN